MKQQKGILSNIFDKIQGFFDEETEQEALMVPPVAAVQVVPAIRAMAGGKAVRLTEIPEGAFDERELTPEVKAYCGGDCIRIISADAEATVKAAQECIEAHRSKHGADPKVILVKGMGLVAIGDTIAACEAVTAAYLTDTLPAHTPDRSPQGRLAGKNAIVTGAAQGFGEGIARCLIKEGANVVVADLNETLGGQTADNLNKTASGNRALFVKTDVSDMSSIEHLVEQTVRAFGGIDLLVSNAGVLRAGTIEEMTVDQFDFVTRINYNAYFYCVKAVAPVMKLQNRFAADSFADIIQINSKSGLRGSKANFAYAGGKFGGVGLTQSFALELAPFRIKVNSICPGNFYEGPLWSDPDNGLFVQYLRAGKVPGAKTVDDVREFYMAQVPMKKGCAPEDVTKAILYAVEQTCETGQAIPVTGGQVMLA